MNPKERSRIIFVFVLELLLLLSIVVYLSHFVIFKSEAVANRPENRTRTIAKQNIKRGSILDRDGNVLAYTEGEAGSYKRLYNEPNIYSHIIGYSSVKHGDYLLERSYRDYLLGEEQVPIKEKILGLWSEGLAPKKKEGADVILTTNTELQRKSYEEIIDSHEKGAVVVLNPKTGEVLAMTSAPSFNANNIDRDISVITEQNEGALLNRATQGLYAPGSTFKIVTAAAILENPQVSENYEDTGEQEIDGRKFKNASNAIYGSLNLKRAFTHSVNTYFVQKTVEIGQDNFGSVADKFYLNQELKFDLPVKNSEFDHSKKLPQTTLAASGIGQGNILTTPLEMAMIASSIANDGKMMKPYLVSSVVKGKDVIYTHTPEVLSEATSANFASQIKEYMISVVREGTGRRAGIRGVKVAGKTGTAETASGLNNAWFVGFAPAEDPKVCVAVLLENVDTHGGASAAPIAKEIIEYAVKELGL